MTDVVTINNAVAHWSKILGNPVPGYDEGSLEWSMDISVDDATIDGEPAITALKSLGLGARIKNKGSDDPKGNFLHIKKNAVKADGTPAKPIRVVGPDNKPWDQDTLIGNGSVVNVQVVLGEYGTGKAKKVSMRPLAVQIWEHSVYEGKGGFKTKDDLGEDKVSKEW